MAKRRAWRNVVATIVLIVPVVVFVVYSSFRVSVVEGRDRGKHGPLQGPQGENTHARAVLVLVECVQRLRTAFRFDVLGD